jgi:hypothetical protein
LGGQDVHPTKVLVILAGLFFQEFFELFQDRKFGLEIGD